MPRPLTITCKGCGEPDVPVQPTGQIPQFCVDCAGYPRNKAHMGWSGAQLNELREQRRRDRQREENQEHVPPEPVAGPGDEPAHHADLVASAQDEAARYWAAQGAPVADLHPPDGPVVLNTPVGDVGHNPTVDSGPDYDPAHDPVLGDVDDPYPVEAGPVGPAVDVVDDPDDLDVPKAGAVVCIAPGCQLPHPSHGHDLFCHGHWRLVSIETRQRVLGAPPETRERNKALHRALFEIRRSLGG